MSVVYSDKGAEISPCGLYRYSLYRLWNDRPFKVALPVVMLNPSTANASLDDPTIRRCVEFARREGMFGVTICNLFAFRSKSPNDLLTAADPYGPKNESTLKWLLNNSSLFGDSIVCAWGADPLAIHAGADFVDMAAEYKVKLVCLGKTKAGHPRHPLYVRGDQPLESYP